MIPKSFIEDLEQIYKAAMEKGNYSAALSAKKLQLQSIASNTKVRIEDLDDETLKGLVGWSEDKEE